MTESDVFAASKRMREDWDNDTDAVDGAFLPTTCPDCGRSVSALIRDTDDGWLGLVCPQCDFGKGRTEWLERRP